MEPKPRKHQEDQQRFDDMGKVPPQAVDLEMAVLGAIMLERDLLPEIIFMIKPEFFYKESHQLIMSAILMLTENSQPVDILTVTEQLKKNGSLELVGGPYYITSLTNKICSAANIEWHVRIITQKFIQREIIRNANLLSKQCFDDTTDIFDTIKELDKLNSEINTYVIGKDYEKNYLDLLNVAYKEIVTQATSGFMGIDTGNQKLNAITGGWQSPDLILLCARPSMGKSTRMINFVKAAINQGKKCAIFSLEMSATQLIKKQIIEQSNVFGNKILESNLTDFDLQKIQLAYQKLSNAEIYLNEKTSVTPSYIKQVCQERKKKYGLDMIFIDYLQLMHANDRNKGMNREQEVSSISSSLKSIAKELQVPVMALSQLNRDLEKRVDKRPIKSDLRESGSLEQDADLILSIYRPSIYYDTENDPDYKGIDEDTHNRISEIGVMKNRHGKSEIHFEERFYGELSRFEQTENI